MEIHTSKGLHGELVIPGDKSISHRAVMLGALAQGTTEISHFLQGADCLSTIDCFHKLGIEIVNTKERVLVHGRGLRGLRRPDGILHVGNSGTTARLLSGILTGQSFPSVLSGDRSLNTRPMKRIMEPLSLMGADIVSQKKNDCAPLCINHALSKGDRPHLHGIHSHSKIASAQVKSAVLLAGLYAEGITEVTEPTLSRNHTELMLNGFGATVTTSVRETGEATTTLLPPDELFAQQVLVPGDISSAAYFIAAGLLVPHSEILIKNVGINPTRAGILKVCKDMGADITYLNETAKNGEPTADLLVRSSSLKGTVIEGDLIPTLIDEIPVIAVMAAFADGTTTIRNAAELKVKESDRIKTTVEGLRAMDVTVTETEDGMIIKGGNPVHGAVIDSYLDHRIAMAFSVAGLAAERTTTILKSECVDVSYPAFYQTLKELH